MVKVNRREFVKAGTVAGIAAAAPAQRNSTELNLIQQGIDQTNVLPRLRATVPANTTAAGT